MTAKKQKMLDVIAAPRNNKTIKRNRGIGKMGRLELENLARTQVWTRQKH